MTVSRATVCSTAYCVDAEKKVLLLYASVLYDTAAQIKTDIAAETKQQHIRSHNSYK